MKRIVVAIALVAAAGLASAQTAPADTYAKKCAMCHGKDGKGTPVGQKMGAKDLTTVNGSEAEIAQVITNGKGKMTAFKGKLSDAEIEGVAKYVKAGLK